jgi:hypothetical protein
VLVHRWTCTSATVSRRKRQLIVLMFGEGARKSRRRAELLQLQDEREVHYPGTAAGLHLHAYFLAPEAPVRRPQIRTPRCASVARSDALRLAADELQPIAHRALGCARVFAKRRPIEKPRAVLMTPRAT